MSFFFGRATGDYIVDLFLQLQEDENKQKYPLPWDALANLSSDGPNINPKIWQLLDTKLKEMGHNGLLSFISCTIHVVHNAFHKGIVALHQDVEGLAHDLHAWFKHSPCKEEDFRELSDSTTIEDSLFSYDMLTQDGWHSLVLERTVERWDDAKEYFLKYLPEKKKYNKSLLPVRCYQCIVKALKK